MPEKASDAAMSPVAAAIPSVETTDRRAGPHHREQHHEGDRLHDQQDHGPPGGGHHVGEEEADDGDEPVDRENAEDRTNSPATNCPGTRVR